MAERPRQGRDRARRSVIAALSAAAHLALVLVLAAARPPAPAQTVFEPDVLPVMLAPGPAENPDPPGPPEEAPAASPAPPAVSEPPPPRKIVARRAPPSPDVEPIPAGETESETAGVGLTPAELASAVGAGAGHGAGSGGGGGGGGQCDMAEMLQQALRRDPEVQAAVAQAGRTPAAASGAILMWRDDWVRSHGQEGAGLAGVREAIMMEVAFAPAACRSQAMQGFILISLDDAPGSARLALGAERWRWSDLLLPRAMRP